MEYRNPKPTVDAIIEDNSKIILINRKNPPHGWALPGGFVNEGESCESACIREAKEELLLDIELIEQFHTYSDPKRDPRQHIMTTVFIAEALFEYRSGIYELRAGDDAVEANFVDLEHLMYNEALKAKYPLVFDHRTIIEDYYRYKVYGKRPPIRL